MILQHTRQLAIEHYSKHTAHADATEQPARQHISLQHPHGYHSTASIPHDTRSLLATCLTLAASRALRVVPPAAAALVAHHVEQRGAVCAAVVAQDPDLHPVQHVCSACGLTETQASC
jgi:hypothetical protein